MEPFQSSQRKKQYSGERTPHGTAVAVVDLETRRARPLPAGLQYVSHSPTGFEWGYLGSGPAQLSFAILLDYFEDPTPARMFYQAFKFDVIADLPFPHWELTTDEITQALNPIRERIRREESA